MTSVFLSYSSKDALSVLQLARDLTERGAEVWLDQWRIQVGDSITAKVQEGLLRSDYLAIWISKHALESQWVEREWMTKYHVEVSSGSTIVLPLLASDVVVPILLRDKKYADFRKSYEWGLLSLCKSLGLLQERVGSSLFRDLSQAEVELQKFLRRVGGALNRVELCNGEHDYWFPYRPNGLYPWSPETGTWKDRRCTLGIYGDFGETNLCFRWSHGGEPWPAVRDPHEDSLTAASTLDGLVYVRDNASRLIQLVKQRLEILEQHGVLSGVHADYREALDSIAEMFDNAGR